MGLKKEEGFPAEVRGHLAGRSESSSPHHDQSIHRIPDSTPKTKFRDNTETKEAFNNRQREKEEEEKMEKKDPLKHESDFCLIRKVREMNYSKEAFREKDNREEEEEEEGQLSLESIGDKIGLCTSLPMNWKPSPFETIGKSFGHDVQSNAFSVHDVYNLEKLAVVQSSVGFVHEAKYIKMEDAIDSASFYTCTKESVDSASFYTSTKESFDKSNRELLMKKLSAKTEASEMEGTPRWTHYQESQVDKSAELTCGIEGPKPVGLDSDQHKGLVGEFGLSVYITYLQLKAHMEKLFRQGSPQEQKEAMETLQKYSKIVGMLNEKIRNTEQKRVPKEQKDRQNQTQKKRKFLDSDSDVPEKKDLESEKNFKCKTEESLETKDGTSSLEEVEANAVDEAAEESRVPEDLNLESQLSEVTMVMEYEDWAEDVKSIEMEDVVDTDACTMSSEQPSSNGGRLHASTPPADKESADLMHGSSPHTISREDGLRERVTLELNLTEEVPVGSQWEKDSVDSTDEVPMSGQVQQDPHCYQFQGRIPYCKSNTFIQCSDGTFDLTSDPEAVPKVREVKSLPEETRDTSLSGLPRPTPYDNQWKTYLGQWDQQDEIQWYKGGSGRDQEGRWWHKGGNGRDQEGRWWHKGGNGGQWINVLTQGSGQGRRCSGHGSGGRGSSGGSGSRGGRGTRSGGAGGGGDQGGGSWHGSGDGGSWRGQGSGDGDDPYQGKPGTKKKKVPTATLR